MNWELAVGVGVPAASGLVWMIYRLGTIDTKLEFLHKGFDAILTRMDHFESKMSNFESRMDRFESRMDSFESRMSRFEKHLHKSTKKRK